MCRSMRPLSVASVLAFFEVLPAREQSAGLSVREILLAEVGDGRGVALGALGRRRVAASHNFAEEPLGFLARRVGRPGRAVAADRVPALATLRRSELEDVGDRRTLLATRAERRDRRVPNRLAGAERSNLFEANSLSAHLRLRMLVAQDA